MDFNEYIDPSLAVLIPILVIFGAILKKSEAVKSKFIPLILLAAGVLLALLWEFSAIEKAADCGNLAGCIFTAVCQGALCCGAAVYSHQIYKNLKENKKE